MGAGAGYVGYQGDGSPGGELRTPLPATLRRAAAGCCKCQPQALQAVQLSQDPNETPHALHAGAVPYTLCSLSVRAGVGVARPLRNDAPVMSQKLCASIAVLVGLLSPLPWAAPRVKACRTRARRVREAPMSGSLSAISPPSSVVWRATAAR